MEVKKNRQPKPKEYHRTKQKNNQTSKQTKTTHATPQKNPQPTQTQKNPTPPKPEQTKQTQLKCFKE